MPAYYFSATNYRKKMTDNKMTKINFLEAQGQLALKQKFKMIVRNFGRPLPMHGNRKGVHICHFSIIFCFDVQAIILTRPLLHTYLFG